MRICAGIITWQDGEECLRNCLDSVVPVVDEIVIADGLIDGVDPHGLPEFSDWLPGSLYDGVPVFRESRRWRSQSAQRQLTLEGARATGCDWLLAIDGDEQLVNGHTLRPWLEVWGWDAFPIPFYWGEDQQGCPCAFKCLHVPYWRRYVAQGAFLENNRGETVNVIGQTWWTNARETGMPHLIHRPELRPEKRQAIRLSEHEVALEPNPPDTKTWREPTYAPRILNNDDDELLRAAEMLNVPIYYCPGCGRRYAGPGFCSKEHELIPVEQIEFAHAG